MANKVITINLYWVDPKDTGEIYRDTFEVPIDVTSMI